MVKDSYVLDVVLKYSTSLGKIQLRLRQSDTMDLDQETQEKIQELQSLEQNMQTILLQKQAFQFELNETENALKELEKSGEEVFKVIGQIMIKSSKEDIKNELTNKKEIISLRLKSIEKQEASLNRELEKIKQEVMKKIK